MISPPGSNTAEPSFACAVYVVTGSSPTLTWSFAAQVIPQSFALPCLAYQGSPPPVGSRSHSVNYI